MLRGDLIEVFKIFKGSDELDHGFFFFQIKEPLFQSG